MKRISRSGLGFPLAAIAAALVICTLAVAAVAGVGSGLGYDTDTEGNPYLEISYTNLELGNETRLYHAIESSGFDYAQKRSMRLLVWSEPQESYLSDNKNISYVLKPDVVEYGIECGGEKKNGVTLFRSEPIAPEKTVDTYYFRAVISDGEREYYSEVSSFGVLDYIYEKLESLEGDSGEGAKRLRELCHSYLTLSAAMQKAKGYKTDRLADSDFIKVTLDGATFSDGFDTMLLKVGESVSIIPNDTDADTVLCAPSGEMISDGKSITVTEVMKSGVYMLYSNTTALRLVGASANGYEGDLIRVAAGSTVDLSSIAKAPEAGYEVFLWKLGDKLLYADPSSTIRYTVPTSREEIRIEALYSSVAYGADFEDGKPLVSGNNISGPQSFRLETTAHTWEIADDPVRAGNKTLRVNKEALGNGTGSGAYFSAAASGKNTVVDFDIYLSDMTNTDLLVQLDLGSSYRIELRGSSGAIYLTDYHNEGALRNDLCIDIALREWHNIRIEYYPSENGMTAATYLDGEAVAVSTNIYKSASADPGSLRFWAMNDSRFDILLDNFKYYKTDASRLEEAKMSAIAYGIPTPESIWATRYNKVLRMYGEEVAEAIENMTSSLFTHEMYEWLAGLYDPKTGGFYYSNSARDNFGYLPDIESTGQSGSILNTFGASLSSVLNAEQKARLASWAQLCQSNEDGYFYHPQWGTDISAGRRSRDLGNFGGRITGFGSSDFLYDHANYRLSGGVSGYSGSALKVVYSEKALTASLARSAAVMVSRAVLSAANDSMPPQFASEEAFRAYLDGLWENNKTIGKSYSIGHTITSQNSQILARGLERVAIDWLNERQEAAQEELRRAGRPLTGLWEAGGTYELDDPALSSYYKKELFLRDVDGDGVKESVVPDVNYTFVSGLLKISGCYNSLGFEMPYAEEALNSAITMIKASAEEYKILGESIVSVYNPPNATNNIMNNISKYGDVEVRNAASRALAESALEIIKTTEEKIAVYRKTDGSFSYSPNNSSSHSQGEPAAVPGSNEGDVNGTALALGARSAVLSVLGCSGIPILETHPIDLNGDGVIGENETHLERFKALICEKKVTAKLDSAVTDGTYTFDDPASLPESNAGSDNLHDLFIRDGILYMKDNDSKKGMSVYFESANRLADERSFYYSADMRYNANASGYSVQLYVGPLKLQFCVSGSTLEFQGRTSGDKYQENSSTFGTLKALEWFKLEVSVYPDGKVVNGSTVYAHIKVTQNGKSYEEYYKDFASDGIANASYSKAHLYTLMGVTPGLELDNVTAVNYGVISLNGEYDFDRDKVAEAPDSYGIEGGKIIDDGDPITEKNNLLLLGGEAGNRVSLNTAYADGAHSFSELMLTLGLEGVKSGEGGRILMLDGSGKTVMAIRFTVTYTEGVSGAVLSLYHDISGQKLLTIGFDPTSPVTVKLEYYYLKSRLDVAVRYTRNPNMQGIGYMSAKAAVLTDVPVSESGASAADYAKAVIETDASRLTIDEVYARRVEKE